MRDLRATSATITGTRAAMWAGLGFGNLFVTYAAKGTFVASFYGSAAASADAMLREAYASTKGPPGPQHLSVDDNEVGGEIRADFALADTLPPNVLLEEVPAPSLFGSPTGRRRRGGWRRRDSMDSRGGDRNGDRDGDRGDAGGQGEEEPRARFKTSPHVQAMEERLNKVQGRGSKKLESELPLANDRNAPSPSYGGDDDSYPNSCLHLGQPSFVVLSKRPVYRNPHRKRGWAKLRGVKTIIVAMAHLANDVRKKREEAAAAAAAAGAPEPSTSMPNPARSKEEKAAIREATALLAARVGGARRSCSGLDALPRTPRFPPMRPSPGGGALLPCNSSSTIGSDKGGTPSFRHGHGRGEEYGLATNDTKRLRAGGARAAARATRAARVYGGGSDSLGDALARVTMQRTRTKGERSATAARFLPQILNRMPPGSADAAARNRKETVLARFAELIGERERNCLSQGSGRFEHLSSPGGDIPDSELAAS